MLISCKKIDDSPVKTEVIKEATIKNMHFSGKGNSVYAWTNENLLKLVISGEGGFVGTSCINCPPDTLHLVEFPIYAPRVNSGGMLEFLSIEDYNSFIIATDLMEIFGNILNVNTNVILAIPPLLMTVWIKTLNEIFLQLNLQLGVLNTDCIAN